MKKWRIDIDLYARYVKSEKLVLYSDNLVEIFLLFLLLEYFTILYLL